MFKVMTWNVQNLFKHGGSFGPTTPEAYNDKIQHLAKIINEQKPDALALQEVGEQAALDDLVAALKGVWHQQVSAHPDPPPHTIRVAWLTPHTITEPEDVLNFPASLKPVQVDDDGPLLGQMGRGAVAITVQAPSGKKVRLITAHLKSKLLTFPNHRFNPKNEDERARFGAYALYRRAAEATTLRVFASAFLGGHGEKRPLILTGDLNDTVQAATTQILQGPPGSEIHTGGFHQHDDGDPWRLWNLAPIMPCGKDYSRITKGRKELIDHIFVSRALLTDLTSVACEAVIEQPLPSVDPVEPNAHRDRPASDHAPVIATFANL